MAANEEYHPILIIISIITCITNCVVIALFSTKSSLRSTGNYILFSLAISDLAVGIFGIPVNIACEIELTWNTCLVAYVGNRFIAVSTVYHILWISLEKYSAIVHPFKHKSQFDKSKVKYICLGTWLGALLLSVIELSWLTRHDSIYKDFPEDIKRKNQRYNIFLFTAAFVVPIQIMAFAYISIFLRILRQHSNEFLRKHVTQREERSFHTRVPQNAKSALLFFVIVLVFILGWFWWFFTVVYQSVLEESIYPPVEMVKFLTILRYCTSFVNPILYTFFKRDFRKALTPFLKKWINRSNVKRVAPQRSSRSTHVNSH